MDPKLSISSLHLERKRPDQTLDEIGERNIHLLMAVIVCSLSWTTGAMQLMTSAFTKIQCENCTMTTIVQDFDLRDDRAHLTEWSTSFFMIGNVIGGSSLTHIADRFGRRPVLLICLFLQAIAAFASAFSPSIYYYAFFKLIHGAFYTGATMVAWVAAYEHSSTGLRSFTTFMFGLAWVIGYCAVAPIAQFTDSWRKLIALAGAPILFVFLLSAILVPETLHFLVEKKKKNRIKKWLKNIEKNVMGDALKLVEEKKELEETGSKWGKFCENKIFIGYCLIQLYLWTCDNFIYFGLSLYSTQIQYGNAYTNYLAMGIIELPAYIITPIVLEKFGRRKVVALSHLIAALSFIANLMMEGEVWTLSCWLIGKLAISCSFMSLFVFASELFPTEIRNIAVGLCAVLSRGGGILAPHISLLGEVHINLPAILLSVMSAVAAGLTLLLPETHRRPLPTSLKEQNSHF